MEVFSKGQSAAGGEWESVKDLSSRRSSKPDDVVLHTEELVWSES